MSKMVLTITTVREIDKNEWKEYKRLYDSHPDTHKIDWDTLENTGSYLDTEHLPTEQIETLYTLEKDRQQGS